MRRLRVLVDGVVMDREVLDDEDCVEEELGEYGTKFSRCLLTLLVTVLFTSKMGK